MSNRQQSRVVFVGNIPYGLTEEQIVEIFTAAGPVNSFRLVHDRETGRPKGYGFAEFPDQDAASSAVRNLNDYEVMGRKLRVDFSNDTVGDEDNRDRDRDRGARADIPQGNYAQPSNGTSNLPGGQPTMVVSSSSSLPPLPQGKDLPPGVSCTDAISKTLNTLPPAQLLDILQQVQQFAVHDPARLTELFTQAPQLTYAVFQGLLLMGLVTPDAINSVLDNPTQPPQAPAAAPMPGGAPPPYGYPGATGTPPVAMGAGYGPPPMVPSPAPAPAPAPAGQDPEALMRAVMELPQETIDQLPEAERQQIMALRASFGMQRR